MRQSAAGTNRILGFISLSVGVDLTTVERYRIGPYFMESNVVAVGLVPRAVSFNYAPQSRGGRSRVEFSTEGTVAQTARLVFGRDDYAWASRGAIISYTAGVTWDVRMPGGLAGGIKRALAGEGLSLARLEPTAPGQSVILGADAPGHIHEWSLVDDGPVLTTRGAFLAAWGSRLDISVSIARRAGAALFGGAGLVLQRISGDGTVLVHGHGDFRKLTLAAGEECRVSTGNLAAFSSSVDYDVEMVGSLRKTFFGKEGLFMTRLQGPGSVLLQTLKPKRPTPRG